MAVIPVRDHGPLQPDSPMKSTTALFIVTGIAVLTALFIVLKPSPSATPDAQTQPSGMPLQSAAPPTIKTHSYEMVIEHGTKRSGPDVMQVAQGDEVSLKISSDHADELHVHGYDLHASVKPGAPTVLSFRADRSGRFTMELHHSNVELGALEVQPR